jgi:hypothetical protein
MPEMIVTVTSIRLRHWWQYFRLTWNAMFIVKQARGHAGFLRLRNTGFGYLHFTVSAWKDEESMRAFARSGAHQKSMRVSRELATELRTYSYPSDRLPDWKTAKALLFEKGKVLSYAP